MGTVEGSKIWGLDMGDCCWEMENAGRRKCGPEETGRLSLGDEKMQQLAIVAKRVGVIVNRNDR